MNIIATDFDNLFILNYQPFADERGAFVKTIFKPKFNEQGLNSNFQESFYSISKKDVIRGMHFQVPPHEHDKLVYVISGRILDVVVDLRKTSKTFGKHFYIELSGQNKKGIFIGKGFAHGFLTLEENSIVEYHTSTVQSKECEQGILWNSFDFNWPVSVPILSKRDKSFDPFSENTTFFI